MLLWVYKHFSISFTTKHKHIIVHLKTSFHYVLLYHVTTASTKGKLARTRSRLLGTRDGKTQRLVAADGEQWRNQSAIKAELIKDGVGPVSTRRPRVACLLEYHMMHQIYFNVLLSNNLYLTATCIEKVPIRSNSVMTWKELLSPPQGVWSESVTRLKHPLCLSFICI